ncbi:MAG: hypothetical protein WBF17_24875, partial [Phycisphaerae bacterium]
TFARPLIRLDPSGRRFIYIRMHGHRAKLHLRRVGSAASDGPVVWDEPIPPFYCRMSFAGLAWRADGQRVLFAQEPTKDKEGWAADVFGRHMRPWHMCYDLPNPQFKLCRHRRIDGAGCTALSYSPDGQTLWTAFSEPKDFKVCGVTGWDSGRGRGRVLYKRTGACIHHLAPSPDGKHLAWLETYPRKPRAAFRGPDVVVFDIKAGKPVHRIGLAEHIPSWLDAQPPVWTADSTAICYGDVVERDRAFRREVYVRPLGGNDSKAIAQHALAVGAAEEGIILNRGPGCVPMRQLISSIMPPGSGGVPPTNDVILCEPSAGASPTTLVPNAFAQQVLPGRIIYAQLSGDDVIVMQAALKPRAKPAVQR